MDIELGKTLARKRDTLGILHSSESIGPESYGKVPMKHMFSRRIASVSYAGVTLAGAMMLLVPKMFAQQPEGPQTSAPAAVGPIARSSIPRHSGTTERITVPAGTRLAVVLENGISTRDAKAGDSVYLRTSFPITQNNRIVIPIGSYVRGELLDAKRPGRIKGRGEFRMRLTTLIFPNGYTVDLLGAPRSADSGGNETMDSEGKVTGPGGKGKDAETVATTTATGAGIGAIASGAKGLGIGAGVGGAAGLAAVLLTRGPEAHLPRGSTLDIVLERDLSLEGDQIRYRDVGQFSPITPPSAREQ
jgi:type IV secretion system protein VirB10